MQRKGTNPNVSPSTGWPYGARFDYSPGQREPSKHDQAKSALWQLPVARKEVLRFFVKFAVKGSRPTKGWTYVGPTAGTIRADELALQLSEAVGFEVSALEAVGACLMSGKYLHPTVSTAGKPVEQWEMPVEVKGVPPNLQQAFVDLRAAA
jgi:hypothetical protein